MVDNRRIEKLNDIEVKNGRVVYWMSRDQRVDDNWSLLYAVETAEKLKRPLGVVFTLADSFSGAAKRQYSFMLSGLAMVERCLANLGIPFFVCPGNPPAEILRFVHQNAVGALITDFSPLKITRKWKKKVAGGIKTAFFEVDSHNIVPCRHVSNKQEFSARTIRPKIHRLLPEFLTGFPVIKRHAFPWEEEYRGNDFAELAGTLKVRDAAGDCCRFKPGESEAMKILREFIRKKLDGYENNRNNPAADGQSNLSPYIHFGQISAQRIAFEVQKAGKDFKSTESFLEELIVRRELSENFCFYNHGYDLFDGFPMWAKRTLGMHRKDRRDYVYSRSRFESAETCDDLWNAAQKQMIAEGKMHGYVRMYWAKKILEWSATPEEALETAIYLNDRYEIDGRDPNGYVGIAWSIGGLHDRPWFKRPVFGSIRYMSRSGMEGKFDVKKFIESQMQGG